MTTTNTTTSGPKPDSRRFVDIGDEIWLVLPASEVCQHLQVAGHLHVVRVLEDGAQLVELDGTNRSSPISHGEAGVKRDECTGRLYAEPLPDMVWRVTLDGMPVSPQMAWQDACWTWTQKHQGQSVDWARTYEGYGWREFPRVDPVLLPGELPTSYEQYAELVTTRFDRDPHQAADALPVTTEHSQSSGVPHRKTVPAKPEYADWGFRYWTEVLDMPADREYACHRCGKPYGH